MVDHGMVAAIAKDLANISVASVLGSTFFLGLSVGVQACFHRFRWGKRVGKAAIVHSSSRIRPVINALLVPAAQVLICLNAMDQGHVVAASLIGGLALFEFLFLYRRIKRYRSEVILFEKAILQCGEYLKFESSESAYVVGDRLHYKKGKRVIQVRLEEDAVQRLEVTIVPPGTLTGSEPEVAPL